MRKPVAVLLKARCIALHPSAGSRRSGNQRLMDAPSFCERSACAATMPQKDDGEIHTACSVYPADGLFEGTCES
ncbi:MAG: hypothetical protein ABI870_15285, partial [Rhodanobacter sp.]